MLLVSTRPAGVMMRASLSPSFISDCASVAMRFCSAGFSARRPTPPTIVDQSIPLTNVSSSAAGCPAAYPAPIKAPMLVPAMQSTGTRISSRTFSTPTWAPPFAPPPASTRPIRGRPCGVSRLVSDGRLRPASNSAVSIAGMRWLSCLYLFPPTHERADERRVVG